MHFTTLQRIKKRLHKKPRVHKLIKPFTIISQTPGSVLSSNNLRQVLYKLLVMLKNEMLISKQQTGIQTLDTEVQGHRIATQPEVQENICRDPYNPLELQMTTFSSELQKVDCLFHDMDSSQIERQKCKKDMNHSKKNNHLSCSKYCATSTTHTTCATETTNIHCHHNNSLRSHKEK